MQTETKPAYLTYNDLVTEYALPKSTVYNLIKNAGFPKGIKLSKQSVRFKREDVEAWFLSREKQNIKGVA